MVGSLLPIRLFIESIWNNQHTNAGSDTTKFSSLNGGGSPKLRRLFNEDALLSLEREGISIESDPASASFKIHEGVAEVRQNVSRIDDYAESLLAKRSGVMHKHRRQNHKISFDSARLGHNN